MKCDKIEIRKNTANTWSVTALDDDGGTLFHMVVDSWDKVVDLIKLAGASVG